tara:strand:+ start:1860 stop:2378 length:519 start_codon:yes stop_codon:yes gene_type:complete
MGFVYYWLRENGTPYYVGYGSHKVRAYAQHPRSNGCVPRPSTDKIHIHTFETQHKARLREWEMINFLKPMLINICPGYSTANAFYGEDNHFYGKQHTKESKRKISESKKGVAVHSKEWKKKKGEMMKGNTNRKGATLTDETKKKVSNAMKGIKRSEETKRKMSEAAKRRWAT